MARCNYELEDFKASDSEYAQLRSRNPELAGKFGYLGSIFGGEGRAWSLADRFASTNWARGDFVSIESVLLVQTPSVEDEAEVAAEVPEETAAPDPAPEVAAEVPEATAAPDTAPEVAAEVPEETAAPDTAPEVAAEVPEETAVPDPAPEVAAEVPEETAAPDAAPEVAAGVPEETAAPDAAPDAAPEVAAEVAAEVPVETATGDSVIPPLISKELLLDGFQSSASVIGKWSKKAGSVTQTIPNVLFAKLAIPLAQGKKTYSFSFTAKSEARGKAWVGLGIHVFTPKTRSLKHYGAGDSLCVWLTRDSVHFKKNITRLQLYRSVDDWVMKLLKEVPVPESIFDDNRFDLTVDPVAGSVSISMNGTERLVAEGISKIHEGQYVLFRAMSKARFSDFKAEVQK